MNGLRHEWTMKRWLGAALAFCLVTPAWADDGTLLETALNRATATFERARPQLDGVEMGVDVAAYRDALTLGQFDSGVWGGATALKTEIRAEATGSCSRYAAFVRIPPENGAVTLVVCPQFSTAGADGLRELTLLHELVHVVAGKDECQAMAFAARVEQAAKGRFTPIDAYWKANNCEASGFSLP